MREGNPELSVVVPVYKASDCLNELHRRLVAVLEQMGLGFEILLVNDASPDASWEVIESLALRDSRVKGVNLSRNFGQHCAITAGLDLAEGDWVVVMDCDLQHVPEEIPRLYEKARQGFDIVYVRRVRRKDGFFKRLASRVFVSIYNFLSDIKIEPSVSSYSIVSRRATDAVRRFRERSRSYTLILNSVGFDVGYIDGEHAERFAGTSAYDLRKLVSFAIDSIASQSNRPLHLSINLGFILSAGSLAAAMWLVIRFLIYGVAVAGWTSVMVSMFFLSGLLFANIGVLGIYLGKVFNESKNRPLYIIKEIVGPSMRDERSSARRGLPTAHVPATDSGHGQAEPLAENSPSYTS